MPDNPTLNKARIAPLRKAMYEFEESPVRAALDAVSAPDTLFRLCHPFGDSHGADAFYRTAYRDLYAAWPDLERRDYIVIAGTDENNAEWVGCAGYYTGTFTSPWLEIPPTGHQVTMRFHEFFRLQDDKVTEFQSLWDLPEVMMQANAWPMAPSLGREWHVPGPATEDGLVAGPHDEARSASSLQIVVEMLQCMKKHPLGGGPEVMELERFWHPRMNWYGPAGVGTGRGIPGFRNWHQIPFLTAMPDRGQRTEGTTSHFFADGDYVGVTGWPNMSLSLTRDGWLGIVPAGKPLTLNSLDFWRIERGLIRENWVLFDILDTYRQLGVDVFARLREFNKARSMGRIDPPQETH